jgi:hypothetical protein
LYFFVTDKSCKRCISDIEFTLGYVIEDKINVFFSDLDLQFLKSLEEFSDSEPVLGVRLKIQEGLESIFEL